ncbi:MAG: HD domain-containing protein [Candidatus Omnitrophota bacterium]|jgi:putative hydrolase of HD superfamily
MRKNKPTQNIICFLAEAGQLKRVKRSGWWVVGIKDPESVAEHSFRCCVIGYMLAKMEKADSSEVLLATLFHDMHEARINDSHKVSSRYIDFKKIDPKVSKEQLKLLPETIARELTVILEKYYTQSSKESIIARDADILECALQAKEYLEFGFKQAKSFLKIGKFLKTRSAQQLFKQILAMESKDWWLHLTNFQR